MITVSRIRPGIGDRIFLGGISQYAVPDVTSIVMSWCMTGQHTLLLFCSRKHPLCFFVVLFPKYLSPTIDSQARTRMKHNLGSPRALIKIAPRIFNFVVVSHKTSSNLVLCFTQQMLYSVSVASTGHELARTSWCRLARWTGLLCSGPVPRVSYGQSACTDIQGRCALPGGETSCIPCHRPSCTRRVFHENQALSAV